MKIYQVDAFNNQFFKGNPAAVCPLGNWIEDSLMQQIAAENNLSETVFFVENANNFEIRWFTPVKEVDLCGHATLAASHIIFTELNFTKKEILFSSKSGILKVTKENDWYTLNFPSESISEIEVPNKLAEALNVPIKQVFKGIWKLLVIVDSEATVKNLQPNFSKLSELESDGIIVTAKGTTVDFVSRFFAPKLNINEDPVTGSAHSILIPYWKKQLNKETMIALQLSEREGFLKCNYLGERVEMSGQAVTFLKGELNL